jgi:hypothetical protein
VVTPGTNYAPEAYWIANYAAYSRYVRFGRVESGVPTLVEAREIITQFRLMIRCRLEGLASELPRSNLTFIQVHQVGSAAEDRDDEGDCSEKFGFFDGACQRWPRRAVNATHLQHDEPKLLILLS